MIGHETYENYDADGGIVSVPNTAVLTMLASIQDGGAFAFEEVEISVYDAAAVPILTWGVYVNGQPIYPWINQRITGTQMTITKRIGFYVKPGDLLEVRALVPATAPGAFDAVCRIKGQRLRAMRRFGRPVSIGR
jgi:hypothetical protein